MEKLFQKIARYFLNLWQLGVLDPQKGLWSVDPDLEKINYLRAKNAQGCHILIKPLAPAHYLMADDIDQETLLQHHRLPNGKWKPARMIVETSPENFQVWIHSKRALSLEEKRIWLQRLRSDPGAHPKNRWGRCPGFRNTKEKHRSPAGRFPLAKLIWIDWDSQAEIPPLNQATETIPLSHPSRRGTVCHSYAPNRDDFRRDDESATDFAYALSLARRGFSDDQIRDRILAQRANWNNHKGERRIRSYLDRTIDRVRQVISTSSAP